MDFVEQVLAVCQCFWETFGEVLVADAVMAKKVKASNIL